MRIVLVDNLLLEQAGGRYDTVLQPHLGLISLIAVAEGAGHEAMLYDPKLPVARGEFRLDAALYREIAIAILDRDPDVVGLTSLGCNFICTVKIAMHLRRLRPGIPVLLGGPHATVLDGPIMRDFDAFDVIVRHEAERTLPILLEALPDRRFHDVPGITYRDESTMHCNPGEPVIPDLDALPLPAYNHFPIAELGLTWLRVEAGRGCPFKCTFCSTASFFGRKYRLKSSGRLCHELDLLHQRYGISHFSLQHDLFTVNRGKVLEFCDAISGRDYTWKCSARMDCVDPELLERMSAAGCREIYFGVETGSPRMQQVSQKRLDLALFSPTLDLTEQARMAATVSFITGYPQEDLADQHATLDLIGSCFYRRTPPHNVQLHLLTPEPGTQLYAEFQSSLAYDGYVSDFNFPTLEPTDSDLMRGHPDVFMNHHYFAALLPRQRHVFVSSFYYVFYRLGPTVIVEVLDRYQGRLSALVEAAVSWAERQGWKGPATDAFLVEFMVDTFGHGDYCTSLVRYMLGLAKFPRKERPDPELRARRERAGRRGLKLSTRYQLSHRAALFRDLHPCPEVLDFLESQRRTAPEDPHRQVSRSASGRAWLREVAAASRRVGVDGEDGPGGTGHGPGGSAPPDLNLRSTTEPGGRSLPAALARTRVHTLVFLPEPGVDQVLNFVMDDRAADVIDFIVTPRTGAQLLGALKGAPGTGEAIRRFARDLLRLGVVEERHDVDPNADQLTRAKTVEWGSGAEVRSFA